MSRIAIVDDSRISRTVFEAALNRRGFETLPTMDVPKTCNFGRKVAKRMASLAWGSKKLIPDYRRPSA